MKYWEPRANIQTEVHNLTEKGVNKNSNISECVNFKCDCNEAIRLRKDLLDQKLLTKIASKNKNNFYLRNKRTKNITRNRSNNKRNFIRKRDGYIRNVPIDLDERDQMLYEKIKLWEQEAVEVTEIMKKMNKKIQEIARLIEFELKREKKSMPNELKNETSMLHRYGQRTQLVKK